MKDDSHLALILLTVSVLGVAACIAALLHGCGMSARGAAYQAALLGCVERADSGTQADACAADVRRRFDAGAKP